MEWNERSASEHQRNALPNFGSRLNSSYGFWEEVGVVEVVPTSGLRDFSLDMIDRDSPILEKFLLCNLFTIPESH